MSKTVAKPGPKAPFEVISSSGALGKDELQNVFTEDELEPLSPELMEKIDASCYEDPSITDEDKETLRWLASLKK